jgi:transposase
VDVAKGMPEAILGIDLGIKKAVCTTLLTEKKVSETRYFLQRDKISVLEKYDDLVNELQHELDTRKNSSQRHDEVSRKLKSIRTKRANIAREYDRVLVRQLLTYIQQLLEEYDLRVALGRVKGILTRARKGYGTGRKYRRLIHSWAFDRISKMLGYGLSQIGWKIQGAQSRFFMIPEPWTSILCWKCGRKGIRPKQSLFICPTCGFKTNADRNGSLNIARRLIKLIPSFRDGKGLGRWAIPERAPAPKASRIKQSKKKSSLSYKGHASSHGEPAVVRYAQLSLLSFDDENKMSDNDPAVEKTVEKLTVIGPDATKVKQEKEVRSLGGISSR